MALRLRKLAPSVTTVIRLDHTHVLMLFRRYRPTTSVARKRAIVTNACLAIEVHAQLEDEIFYPAMRRALPSANDVLDKSEPEHAKIKQMIGRLRSIEPGTQEYDDAFRDLIRKVLHHVSDEETVLLPLAEQVLGSDVYRLGGIMARRKLQLLRPRAREVASTSIQAFPVISGALVLAAVGVGVLLMRPRAKRLSIGDRLHERADQVREAAVHLTDGARAVQRPIVSQLRDGVRGLSYVIERVQQALHR